MNAKESAPDWRPLSSMPAGSQFAVDPFATGAGLGMRGVVCNTPKRTDGRVQVVWLGSGDIAIPPGNLRVCSVHAMAELDALGCDPRAIVRARIDALGLRKHQVAERVAPLWRLSPRDAASKLDHYLAGERDINSTAYVQLCEALGLAIVAATSEAG